MVLLFNFELTNSDLLPGLSQQIDDLVHILQGVGELGRVGQLLDILL